MCTYVISDKLLRDRLHDNVMVYMQDVLKKLIPVPLFNFVITSVTTRNV